MARIRRDGPREPFFPFHVVIAIDRPFDLIAIIILFAVAFLATVSETAVPARKPEPPSATVVPPPSTPAAHQIPAADEIEKQLPYFFILQLPSLISEDPTWSDWGPWTSCPTSCGDGPPSKRSSRRRHCQGAIESACRGDAVQWRACKTVPCPAEGSSQAPRPATTVPRAMDEVLEKAIAEDREKVEVDGTGGVGSSGSSSGRWTDCLLGQCPFKIQLRRRWCYLGQYCVGRTSEMRVCGPAPNEGDTCGTVNTSNIPEFSDGLNHSSPWTDPRIGWSAWTAWTTCSVDCGYHLQTVNLSAPCLTMIGQMETNCRGQNELVRVCGEQTDPSGSTSTHCGLVADFDRWSLTIDEGVIRRRFFIPSSSRIIHAIIIFVLFAPPIILLFYWLLTRAHRPRYESLPSAATAGDPSLSANGQPTISADVTSALGPNHLTLETGSGGWKPV